MPSILTRENVLRWVAAIGCFAVVIFFFCPSWGAFALWSRVPEAAGMLEVRRGVSVLQQVAHPGAPIADPLHQAIQWRLLFPVIGHVLSLPTPLFFALADVGAFLVLGYLVSLLRQRDATWRTAIACTVVLGAASWFFVSTGWLGYFDSWLALGLLIVAFSRRRWAVWGACLWAPWVDERFVIGAIVALVCRWVADRSPIEPLERRRQRWLEYGTPAALITLFVLIRFIVLAGQSGAGATLSGYFSGHSYLDAPFGRIALGVWEGLRGGWAFVIAAVFCLRNAPGRSALVGIVTVVVIAVGLATAQDYSRSMTMLLPVAVLGTLLVVDQDRPHPRLLVTVVGAALLLPAHHVMNDEVNPIYYLYHELAAFDSPPPAAMPELRELHAIEAMERGDFATAEKDLTLAIQLSPNPAAPARRRGILYASAKRWDDAKRDFTLVIEKESENPDGWLLRTQVELAMGDFESARSDFEHARSVAPTNWINRPDVARVQSVLKQPMGQR